MCRAWSCADHTRKSTPHISKGWRKSWKTPTGRTTERLILEKGKDAALALGFCGTALKKPDSREKLQSANLCWRPMLHELVLLRVTKVVMQHDTRLTGTLHGDFATA